MRKFNYPEFDVIKYSKFATIKIPKGCDDYRKQNNNQNKNPEGMK